MPLPKIAIPTFRVELPMSKRKLECRPYLVKEDKILLMAAQDPDPMKIAMATRQVINACVQEDKFDVSDLAALDADYLFMHLRAKSVGEVVNVEITCNNTKEDETVCKKSFEVPVTITDIKLFDEAGEKRNAVVKLSDSVGVKMKPTTFRATLDADLNDEVENNIITLYNSIEQIFDSENVYTPKDFTMAEFKEWINEIDPNKFSKLIEYINSLPILRLEKDAVCPECKHQHHLKFEEPMNFF